MTPASRASLRGRGAFSFPHETSPRDHDQPVDRPSASILGDAAGLRPAQGAVDRAPTTGMTGGTSLHLALETVSHRRSSRSRHGTLGSARSRVNSAVGRSFHRAAVGESVPVPTISCLRLCACLRLRMRRRHRRTRTMHLHMHALHLAIAGLALTLLASASLGMAPCATESECPYSPRHPWDGSSDCSLTAKSPWCTASAAWTAPAAGRDAPGPQPAVRSPVFCTSAPSHSRMPRRPEEDIVLADLHLILSSYSLRAPPLR
jgi:hypothetical protein